MEVTTDATFTPDTGDNSTSLFVESQIAEGIWKYCSFVLIAVGTVGNVLAICILLRRNMRNSTTMFYLTILAFADMVVLYTGLMRQWVKYAFDYDLRTTSTGACRWHLFFVYFSLDASVWTMVLVTIDRTIFICFPFRAKTFCTLLNARCFVAVTVGILALLNIHFFWLIELRPTDSGTGMDCEVLKAASRHQIWFTKTFHPWLDFCMFSVIPFSIMLIGNCLIIRKIALSRRRLLAHAKREDQSILSVEISTISQPRRVQRKTRRPCCSSVTVTLLTVSIVFLLTTSPIVVFLVGHDKWFADGDGHARAVLSLIWAIVNMFQYLNNAIHFFLYCLTGPKFRRELMSLCRRKNKVAIVVDQSTTLEVYQTNTVHP